MRIELLSPAVKRWFTIVMVVISVIAIAYHVGEVRSGNLRIYDGAINAARDITWSMPAVFLFVVAAVNRKVLKSAMAQYLGLKTGKPAEGRARNQNGQDADTGGTSFPDGEQDPRAGKTDDRPSEP